MPAALKQRFQTGFTLLELMVVVTIIALMATTVMLTMPDGKADSKKISTQKAQLAAVLRSLAQSSMLKQQWQGLYFEDQSYQSMIFSNSHWQLTPKTEAKQIPAEIPILLLIDNQILENGKATPEQQADILINPQIIISPIGLFNSFELRFGDEQLAEDSLSDPYAIL